MLSVRSSPSDPERFGFAASRDSVHLGWTGAMSKVTLSGVYKRFGSQDVIRDINFEIGDKEFVVFVGPSGCGKSTLLRMIAGLEDISQGEISIDGEIVNDLPPSKRKISMVFQNYALYPHKTVRDNIGFALRLAKIDKRTIQNKVEEVARVLELEALLERKPKQLSGGQRQRVAIGRAIVREPRLFLFDEPLSNLDAALRGQMRIEIARLHKTLKTTMIFVTHDQVEAMTLADKIVVLNKGRIEQVGTPMELYLHPSNRFVASFIGSPKMNFIKARVDSVADGSAHLLAAAGTALTCPIGTEHGLSRKDEVTIGIRPEDLSLGEQGLTFRGVAQVVEHLGAETHVIAEMTQNEVITAVLDGKSSVKVGDVLSLSAATDHLHLFDANGKAIASRGRP
jgi:multiple sugar transport system ATP-binding protein